MVFSINITKTLNKKEIKTENQVWGPPSMSYLVIITLAQKVVSQASLTSEKNDIFLKIFLTEA